MTIFRKLKSFSPRNRIYVEMLRASDSQTRLDALAELCFRRGGRLDDELAAELCSLLATSRDLDFRLQICEDLALTLADGACLAAEDEDGERGEDEGVEDEGVEDEGVEVEGVEDEGVEDEGVEDRDEDQEEDLDEDEEDEGGRTGRLLGRRAFAALQECLADLYRDPRVDPRLRRKILEVAVLSPQPWHEPAVRECWARPEPEWRATALSCMGHLYPADFADEIAEGLESPFAELRAEAIAAADDCELRGLGPRILELAADRSGDLEVMLCAIEALPNLRPPGARELLQRLRGAPAPVGHFAADALLHLEENRRAEEMIAGLRGAGPHFIGPI